MKIIYFTLLMLFSLQVVATPPTVPASNLGFYIIDGGYFNICWTAGNGSRRILICKAGSPVTFTPQNGIGYSANTVFGSGQQVAPGEYVVYDNAFTSFYLTGLTAATQYYFALYEYNGSGATAEYLTSSFLTGNSTTSSTPAVQASNALFPGVTINSITLTWTNGNGFRRLILMREGAAVNADPVNNTVYNENASFGTGAQVGAGNFAVYKGTGTSTTISNLKPGTQYHLAFYEFNGSGQPQYLTPAYTTTVTTRNVPTIASSNVSITKTDGKELTLSWTRGNGQRRIIVAKAGSDVTALPANNNSYTANAVFGSGTQLAPGEYVVFDDNFNIATVKGLNAASTYYFKIFEYDGGAGNASYLTSAYGSVNGSTAVTPTLQANNLNAATIGAQSLTVTMSAGNGRARMVVARKNTAVNFIPQDFTVYQANSNFGSGQDLGNGNYVISNTTGLATAVSQLEPNTTYHFAVFEYNGFDQPLYSQPAAVFSAVTTGALPVKLVKWEAIAGNKEVMLQWTTSTEMNSSHFIIQRSRDGNLFMDFASVPAAGTSQLEKRYYKVDDNPMPGRSFYRLKMVDKDGSFEYASILTVMADDNKEFAIVQNPVQQYVELITSLPINGSPSQWQIFSASGQAIKQGSINNTRMLLDVAAIPPGNYWLRVSANHRVKNIAFTRL